MAALFPEDVDDEYSFSESNKRCLKCVFVVMNEFPKMLQAILHKSGMPATTMYTLIQNDRRFKQKLSREDHHALQSLTTDNYSGLDLTLIFKILTNYTNIFIDPPTRGWNSTPLNNEILIGDDAQRLRLLRNNIFHKFDACIDEAEFNVFFSSVEDISDRIDTYLNLQPDESFQSKIERYKHHDLNLQEARQLQNQYDEEKDISEYFILESGDKKFRVFKTKSFTDFITEIRSQDSEIQQTGPITLTFPELDNVELVKIMEDLKDEINKGLVNVKVERVKEGSLVIQVTISMMDIVDEGLTKKAIQHVLLEYLAKNLVREMFPTSCVLLVSMSDCFLSPDELPEKISSFKIREKKESLQLDLQFQRDALLSEGALRETMTSIFTQIGSKVNGNQWFQSPVVSVVDVDQRNIEDQQSERIFDGQSRYKAEMSVNTDANTSRKMLAVPRNIVKMKDNEGHINDEEALYAILIHTMIDGEYGKTVIKILNDKEVKCKNYEIGRKANTHQNLKGDRSKPNCIAHIVIFSKELNSLIFSKTLETLMRSGTKMIVLRTGSCEIPKILNHLTYIDCTIKKDMWKEQLKKCIDFLVSEHKHKRSPELEITHNAQLAVIKKFKYDLFIIYTSSDFETARDIVEHLEFDGLKCCFSDRDFIIGELIINNIVRSIQESCACLIIHSKHFSHSEWCSFEVEHYLSLSRPIIIVKIDDSRLEDKLKRFRIFDIKTPRRQIAAMILETIKLVEDKRQRGETRDNNSIFCDDQQEVNQEGK